MEKEDWMCTICLDDNSKNICTLEPCNHKFHSDCIITSLRINGKRCPLCRREYNDILNVNTNILPIYNFENKTFYYDYSNNTIYDIAGNDLSDYVNMV